MSNPNGRQGLADRTGNGWRSYADARRFVRGLGIRSVKRWRAYSHGEAAGMPDLPSDIPKNPHYIYRDVWQGYPDWLGKIGRRTSHVGRRRSVVTAPGPAKTIRAVPRPAPIQPGALWMKGRVGNHFP